MDAMSHLGSALNRLYFVSEDGCSDACMISPNGMVKAMVLELSSPAAWSALSAVWQGVQQDLDLPAPAIAISGTNGLQLWFLVGEAVPIVQAIAFLESLQKEYFSDTAPKRLRLFPTETAAADVFVHAPLVPAYQESNGNWSAFVSSDLASIFGEEPWLDLPPNEGAQAELLARVKPMKLVQFQQRLEQIRGTGRAHVDRADEPNVGINGTQMTPRDFLQEVMRNPEVPLQLRVQAAKALLPYT